ncbi:hypothetical protein ACQ4PT_021889 [Festuca glaucescens]
MAPQDPKLPVLLHLFLLAVLRRRRRLRVPPSAPAAPAVPRPVPAPSTPTPFPTTFVQADSASFKQVVQMLTGADMPPPAPSSSAQRPPANKDPPPRDRPVPAKKPAFQAVRAPQRHEEPQDDRALAMASAAGASPRKALPELLSPSVLDFPSLALSPVTPLVSDPFNRSASASPAEQEAAAAGARGHRAQGLLPHPLAPRRGPAAAPALFPVTSPEWPLRRRRRSEFDRITLYSARRVYGVEWSCCNFLSLLLSDDGSRRNGRKSHSLSSSPVLISIDQFLVL